MIELRQEPDALTSRPTRERLRALKRIIPRARVEEALARCGHDRAVCPRLPGWFLVWFVIALGLFCRDCYRQVFRWLQPFRPGAIPPRSTLCEARQRLGVAPMRLTAERVLATIRAGNAHLKRIGIANPRIAVAGLNPHAGEDGALGREEIDIIQPAIQRATVSPRLPSPPVMRYEASGENEQRA